MYKNKRFLAVIPARSGSKGLVDKNIKMLQGKPMMAYSIEAAKESCVFQRIIVSTDSEKYAAIAKEYGGEVPWLRVESLSHDTAKSVDVVLNILDQLEQEGEEFDYLILLQPTSPLREGKHIQEAVDLLLEKNVDSVVSFTPCDHPPEWTCKESQLGDLALFQTELFKTPRQLMETSYQLNGSIYISKITVFREENSFFAGKSMAYVMDRDVSLDVDSEEDFKLVEYYLKEKGIIS